MTPVTVRTAAPEDGAAVAAIYRPYVADTCISFELEPPSASEMAARIRDGTQTYPWLVAERDGAVLGYAYASKHRERAAYLWSVDVAVYVRSDAHRQGIGRSLYTELFDLLRRQGFRNAYAGITLPNPSSVGLHEAMGFSLVGVYRDVGYKLGGWRDVGWWQLNLLPYPPNPDPPRPLPEIAGPAPATR